MVSMMPGTAGSPVEAMAYLARSEHRLMALRTVASHPRSPSELSEETGASSSTIRRTVREFEERGWIRRDEGRYEPTELGAFIASAIEDLFNRLETERQLRGVSKWLPGEDSGFPIEKCAEADVTVAEPDDPYAPVRQFESLFQEATRLRFLRPEIALMEPAFDVLLEHVNSGVEITFVDRPSCNTYFLSTYPEHSPAMMRRDNFTVLEHVDLPSYGLALLDHRVAISGYEEESGTVQLLVDTDSPEVRAWAEAKFSAYADEAELLPPPEPHSVQIE